MEALDIQNLRLSSEDFLGRRTEQSARKDHALLSFLSLFAQIMKEMTTGLYLSTIVLGPALNIQDPLDRGAFFSITLAEATELSQSMLVTPEKLNPLPDVVALKIPILKGEDSGGRNERIFTSMANELQILRDDAINEHENIVTLLGVCWQVDSDDQLLPVFVMEASEIGNLRALLNERTITLVEKVAYCMDIALAIAALHGRGVIHSDIKPENVLLFSKDSGKYVAKICDFGSSVLEATAGPDCELTGGTKIWQAPEVNDAVGFEALQRTDIYSFGLVFWYIFLTEAATAILDCDPVLLSQTKASSDFLDTVMETFDMENQPESSSSVDEDTLQLQKCMLCSTLAASPEERWDADALLNCLSELATSIRDGCDGNNDDVLQQRVLEIELSQQRGRQTPRIEDRQSDDGILHVIFNQATINLLPTIVVKELENQLEQVAQDDNETRQRRARASYEYAMNALTRLWITGASQTDAEKPLTLLSQAAAFGNPKAQYCVNIMHEAFDRPPPFAREAEIPWLVSGTILGSMTARKRLELLDPSEARNAIQTLRLEYGGIGLKTTVDVDVDYLQDHLELYAMGRCGPLPRVMQGLARVGDIAKMQMILRSGTYDVNNTDVYGETALLVACVGGHSSLVELLLCYGADPTLANMEQLTPLHFLSAFDNNDTLHIANLLVASGADIEARSTSGTTFNKERDGLFGFAEGTPLLWAVAARNAAATRALLELGADPFDEKGGSLPVSKTWRELVNYSPVDVAARMHLEELLQMLLEHCKRDTTKSCEGMLNSCYRAVAPHPEFAVLPMFWAVTYTAELLLERLLIHGQDHQKACKRTIQTLIKYGASTSELGSNGRSALHIASSQGHIFLTAYLVQFDANPTNIQPWEFLDILHNAAKIGDFDTFNLLLEYGKGVALDDKSAGHFFALTVESTDNVYFVDYYLNNERWQCLEDRNDTEMFERALRKGNFDVAQRIFQEGRVDLCRQLRYENGECTTLFGRLMARARRFKNGVDRVRKFLEITGGTEEAFVKVIRMRGMDLTALHVACIYSTYESGLAAAGPVMDLILEYYKEPHHLNAQITAGRYAGFTALHLAIDCGNLPAAARLLQTQINIHTLNDQGESALDMVKVRWRNQDRFMADVPVEKRRSVKERNNQITERLNTLLEHAGAKCKRYMAQVRKIDSNTVSLEVFGAGNPELLALNENPFKSLESSLHGIGKVALELKPDHMFLISLDRQTFEVEAEVFHQLNPERSQQYASSLPTRRTAEDLQDAEPSSLNAAIPSRERVARDTPFTARIVSPPSSVNTSIVTSLDGDLGDFCDYLRRV